MVYCARPFSTSKTISVPYTVDTGTLGRPTVVLKARSNPNNVPGHSKCNDDRMCLQYLESLTVVESPPGDVFRPPYFGTEKPMFPASRLGLDGHGAQRIPPEN